MAASARLSVRLAAVPLLLAASVAALNIVNGRSATTSHVLINHPKVAMVSLTARPSCPQLRPNHLAESYRLITETLDVIENNAVYINVPPKMRTTAWKAWTLRRGERRKGLRGRETWPCYGSSICRTEPLRCST